MKHKHARSFDLLSRYDNYYPGVGGIFALLGLLLAGACIGNLIVWLLTKYAGAAFATTYGTLISYPVQFLPAMIYAAAKSKPFMDEQEQVKVDQDHFAPIGGFWLSIMAIVATWAIALVCEPTGLLLPPMPDILKEALKSITDGPIWVSILCAAVFAPFFEEWLCRGMVMRGLLQKVHPAWAIVISAAFFALIHLNPWQGIPAFLIGCLLGLVYWKTGSLKLTMLMHCANNLTSVILSHIPRFKDCDYMFEAIGNPTISILLYSASAALVVLFVTRMMKTTFTK